MSKIVIVDGRTAIVTHVEEEEPGLRLAEVEYRNSYFVVPVAFMDALAAPPVRITERNLYELVDLVREDARACEHYATTGAREDEVLKASLQLAEYLKTLIALIPKPAGG